MSIYKYLIHLYFTVRNSYPIWFGLLNIPSRNFLKKHPVPLSAEQERIVSVLRSDGVAFSSLDKLFPGENVLETLQAYATTLENNVMPKPKKKFLVGYWEWEGGLTLDITNPFVRLALDERSLAVVNSYQQLATKLNYYILEKTLPVGDSEPTFSQRWHRDPQEIRTCKMFVYLHDVDEEAGPFIYVKGSAPLSTGPYAKLFPQVQPVGSYPETAELERSVTKGDIVTATGKAGTVIFCDTAGFHRGGYAKSKHRLMFTAFYPSPWWSEKPQWTYPHDMAPLYALSPAARYALSLK